MGGKQSTVGEVSISQTPVTESIQAAYKAGDAAKAQELIKLSCEEAALQVEKVGLATALSQTFLALKALIRKMRRTSGESMCSNSIKGWNHRGEILSTLKRMVELRSVLHTTLPVCWVCVGVLALSGAESLGLFCLLSKCKPALIQKLFSSGNTALTSS